MAKECARPTCTRVRHRAGLCHAHYDLKRRNQPNGYVPIQPLREHVAELHDAGLSYEQIAQRAGVSRAAVITQGVLNPKRVRMRAVTAKKLLNVSVPNMIEPDTLNYGYIPSVGTVRRLQALVAIGYGVAELGGRCGLTQQAVTEILHGRQSAVRAGTARSVAAVFRQLQLTPVDNPRSVNRAKRFGWPPPLAWDECSIDDPAAVPDVGEKGSFADFLLDARELNLPEERMAEVLGITVGSLRTRIRRLAA